MLIKDGIGCDLNTSQSSKVKHRVRVKIKFFFSIGKGGY